MVKFTAFKKFWISDNSPSIWDIVRIDRGFRVEHSYS